MNSITALIAIYSGGALIFGGIAVYSAKAAIAAIVARRKASKLSYAIIAAQILIAWLSMTECIVRLAQMIGLLIAGWKTF